VKAVATVVPGGGLANLVVEPLHLHIESMCGGRGIHQFVDQSVGHGVLVLVVDLVLQVGP
jgi:hypothetical protein